MMPAFPSTSSGLAANSSTSWQCHKCGCCNTRNPNCCLSCQAWKVGIAPIIALTVCMREPNGGVNGAMVILKLHKVTLLFSLVNPHIMSCCHVGHPCDPCRPCQHCATFSVEHAPPISLLPPFTPLICLPKGPVNVQWGQSNRMLPLPSRPSL